MDSELSNCVDTLAIFNGFRYLTMYKQPKLEIASQRSVSPDGT